MKIKFIGTGSGKASLVRYHSSLLITEKNYNLLIDAGDGISFALIKSNIPADNIDGIVITHNHPDHLSGLTSLINQMKLNKRTKPLSIFVLQASAAYIKELLEISYIFPEKLTFKLSFIHFESDKNIGINDIFDILPIKNSHITNKYNITSLSADFFTSVSLIIKTEQKNIIYSSDIGTKDDFELFKSRNKINLLVTETVHINFSGILEAIKSLCPDLTVLTHIDESFENELKSGLLRLTSAEKENILIAYDTLCIDI